MLAVINGSLNGKNGNTEHVLREMIKGHDCRFVYLKESSYEQIRPILQQADGIIIGTGVYWSTHSSYLQKFFEDATQDEGTGIFLGKPLGIIVTNHSVGGLEVISKIMLVMNLLGCVVPPLSCVTYSKAVHFSSDEDLDYFKPSHAKIVLNNILAYINMKT